MESRRYLPSTQFATIAVALLVSLGLVLAAQYVTRPPQTPTVTVASSDSSAAQQQSADWQQALQEVELASGSSLPQTPDASTTQALLAAAQSSNVTATVARSLLVNLSNDKAQGLGDDTPTQDQLVAQAISQLPATPQAVYGAQDLHTVPESPTSLRAYGNAVMQIFAAHTGATSQATLQIIGKASDSQNPADLAALEGVQAEYQGLVQGLAAIEVPDTLVPLQVEALNNLADAAQTFGGMETMIDDPLRALSSMEQYDTELGEAGRVFTTIAQTLNKDGIIFTKDEPGSAWSGFLSTSQ